MDKTKFKLDKITDKKFILTYDEKLISIIFNSN